MNKQGDYVELARLAREKREQSEYVDELRSVLTHCHSVQRTLDPHKFIERRDGNNSERWEILKYIAHAIDIAEQELKRLGVEI